MTYDRTRHTILAGFILISLILHLAILYLLPRHPTVTAPPKKEPVYVEVRPHDRELDLSPPEKETIRETPAERLGPADQVVEKETAPKGDFIEDRTPVSPLPQPTVRDESPPPPAKTLPAPPATISDRPAPPPQPQQPPTERKPLDLLAAGQMAAQAVAERYVDEWRRKYRKEVEEGDAVWLDTEKDILHSFFRRFRDQIYGVWNYPSKAAERREEGTCLLKVTVDRHGEVVDVSLMESSGHDALDREAINAVWKGGPYGTLSRYYTKETLSIFAFFQYQITPRRGRPREIF